MRRHEKSTLYGFIYETCDVYRTINAVRGNARYANVTCIVLRRGMRSFAIVVDMLMCVTNTYDDFIACVMS